MVHGCPLGKALVWKDPGQGTLAVVPAVVENFIHAFLWEFVMVCSFFQFCGHMVGIHGADQTMPHLPVMQISAVTFLIL